ncbi:hypothetical protein [Candidatus Albibeggiatoa sp. nov. NOAA]|uniref:hypothetical protein n=1 Tax=Candidatus Albibeggiatoa sp. nov. NOAA TaxID=3162724 RepID=UPI0032FF1470|nr:hypothetical protein [Thiotrichaceae bacterium]
MSKKPHYLIACVLSLLIGTQAFASEPAASTENKNVIRLAIVNTPAYSGFIQYLLEDFEKNTDFSVKIYNGADVYNKARAGKADIVISHYGKKQLKQFVLDGLGSWPKMVFSNQAVLIGSKDDPANIRNLSDAATAFSQIAKSKALFINNAIPNITYLTDILWDLTGQPIKQDWFLETGQVMAQVALRAEKEKAYFIWGAYPFLRYKQQFDSQLEILVSDDPLLQRMMSSTLVNPEKIPNVNHEGAVQLQSYLLEPATQAKIATFRAPETGNHQLWWPAGRHN